MWPHEGLLVYQRSVDAIAMWTVSALQLPPHDELRDQLRRASASIVLNLAEGASEWSRPEKDRFFRMARRSAAECAAVLDIVERVRNNRVEPEIRVALDEVGALLTALIRRRPPE